MAAAGPRQEHRWGEARAVSPRRRLADLPPPVKKRKAVLAWLLPAAFEDIHADISKARQDGTGTWLLEALDGLRWEQGDVLLVWGHGIGECDISAGADRDIRQRYSIFDISHIR